jgi:hypothetical protein
MNENQKHQPPVVHGWSPYRTQINGTSFFRSNMFVFLTGQLILLCLFVASQLITKGQNDQKFTDLSLRVGAVEAVQHRMDENGTNFSHYNLAGEDKRLQSIEARMLDLENRTAKIDVMAEKISRIDDTLKEMRASQSFPKR